MSFTVNIKEEITFQQFSSFENFFELTALLHFGCEVEKNHEKTILWFKTKNLKIARRFLILIKAFYPNTNSFLMTSKEYNLPHLKSIHIGIEKEISIILKKHNFLFQNENTIFTQLKTNLKAKQAYLRGSFFCIGHVNDPKKNSYHLEFFHKDVIKIQLIQKIMLSLNFNAKKIQHKKGFLTYLKESQMIIDFLRLIGALGMVFQYEDIIINKEFKQNIKSTINFEISNEQKIINTANKQLKQINLVEKQIKIIPKNEKILQIIQLRKKYPDLSLKELTQKYNQRYNPKITKSGLNYYFQKIKEISTRLKTNFKNTNKQNE
ncbi:DNA-binding protein WhiA ['Fragaria x ananassa' phyllody phytoplasma]|uniref:Probable cell division protein WhiA n=1 Tax='Fragaria x ananassa' phyllody phytoplasma TaxID=2358428 RepID=A0ABS5K3F4_9MOLU|nr:DNA-binding protein WhiA ['Fragaria x ananassa' phyllody phytoplasma]MBS2126439.1 DNA-binding protein WhiA ['Fragaria x ananassa' phyllody phytoplasma]